MPYHDCWCKRFNLKPQKLLSLQSKYIFFWFHSHCFSLGFSLVIYFYFWKICLCWLIKNQIVVATSNYITNNQAPVPSVCVRVPHSPSLSSGENSVPGSPVEKAHHDFTTLVVREFINPRNKTKQEILFSRLLFSLHVQLFPSQLSLSRNSCSSIHFSHLSALCLC